MLEPSPSHNDHDDFGDGDDDDDDGDHDDDSPTSRNVLEPSPSHDDHDFDDLQSIIILMTMNHNFEDGDDNIVLTSVSSS